MDIRFWYGATTDCTVADWNNDEAFEPWSKLYIPRDGQARYAVARVGESPVWTALRPGQIYLIPGGRRQLNACRSGFCLVWVHFTVQDDDLAARLSAMDVPVGFPLATVPGAEAALANACLAGAPRLRACALVLELLSRLADPPIDAHAAERRRLAPVLERMGAQLDLPIPVEALARQAGLGVSRFQEVFRRLHGTSVHDYRLRLRIAEASRLLRHTELPVADIALRCGYRNPFNFTRAFTGRMGRSPMRYRRSEG